jgi:hypothetical protein
MGGGGAVLGRIREDVAHDDVALVDQARLFACISSVSVGKPAMRSAPIAISGRAALSAGRVRRLGAAVAALHALEDHVVARLKAHVEVRHEARLAGDDVLEPRVDLDAVE